MQSDEDREQPWENGADSSPVYTTQDADVSGGGGGVGGGDGEGGGGSRGDSSRRRPSDGGSTIRKKKKNEVGEAARLHQTLDEIT